MKKINQTVILGVTSSIAAYKMTDVASSLAKDGYDVHVIMTKNATEIIAPLTFSTLTGNKCIVDTFDKNADYDVAHVSLAQKADLLFIAPATANTIGKLSYGIADNMLTTTALACTCPKVIAPAMNTDMYINPIVKNNIERLRRFGYEIITPDSGILACKDVGLGKLPKPEVLLEHIYRYTSYEKDMEGLNVLVTAGATMEAIDPVRYITNHSSGKMGYALAKTCMQRGANVTLISGNISVDKLELVNDIKICCAKELFEEVKKSKENSDIIIMAAAVADYRPKKFYDGKVKKKDEDLSIELERTDDILSWIGHDKKEKQYVCGFSMETEDLIKNSLKKLEKKNADMIVANSLSDKGSGFKGDTNIATILTRNKKIELPLLEKTEVAEKIIDNILNEYTS
ncbi:MAG TPA: bifunctional phosphopantothenoylcysteine decarboxylase/phosphopantothenate--cysteine ligase CoaBC [Anaerovoracaceae bacterium]|nr:bifunctional phosphopantothenoylcysteine decarboxylase/phosphopantothenate--cysteine ligase CoaBC [Anaerovoracaceae bacterium]